MELVDFAIEACPICFGLLKSALKEGVTAKILLPLIHSSSVSKHYYKCAHSDRKRKIHIECIRCYRDENGLTIIKFSNNGRRRYLQDMYNIFG